MNVYHQIMLDNGVKYYALGDQSLKLKFGDACIVNRGFYQDYGRIFKVLAPGANPPVIQKDKNNTTVISPQETEPPTIVRKANDEDKAINEENLKRQKEVLSVTLGFVDKLGLKMKLINAHFAFDGKLLSIQFTSDGRVDFRELVKLLCQQYTTKIELKQIGVKDEACILGGIAPCGREVCCSAFLADFPAVNAKMVKEQDMSPGSQNASGICGRIKCCMAFEYEGYLELDKGMPRRGDICECKDGAGKVIDRNLLTGKVVVQLFETGRNVTCDHTELRPCERPREAYMQKTHQAGDSQQEQQQHKASKPAASQHNDASKGTSLNPASNKGNNNNRPKNNNSKDNSHR